MTFEAFLFYLFAFITVAAAVNMITIKNPVHAALSLVLVFVSSAGLWLLLEAEFLGIVLVLVYVGAVMVMFLFVVMMLDINLEEIRAGFVKYLPYGVVVAVVMAAQMIVVLKDGDFIQVVSEPKPAGYSNTKELGSVLYTEHVYSFEIAAVILLVAIVAAIALTFRRRTGTKYLNPADQIKVKAEDRLRVVDMKSERKS